MTNTTNTQATTTAHLGLDLSKLAEVARAADDDAADILEQAKAVAAFTHTFTPPVASALVALAQQAAARPAPLFWYDAAARIERMELIDSAYQAHLLVCNEKFGAYTTPLYAVPVALATPAPAGDAKDAAAVTSVLRAHGDLEAVGLLVSTRIIQIGNLMSNVMYELAQQVGTPLPRYECQQMEKLHKDWDAAMNTIAKLAQQQGGA